MHHDRTNPASGQTRREFIRRTAAATAFVAAGNVPDIPAQAQPGGGDLALLLDAEDAATRQAPVQWAAGQLRESLQARGIGVQSPGRIEQVAQGRDCILVGSRDSALARRVLENAGAVVPEAPEALGLVRGRLAARSVLLACGSDVRGLVYALLELADVVACADAPLAVLARIQRTLEQPANPIRSIARLFTSDVEDKPWFYDKAFWARYLTMLAMHRFNRFNLTLGLGYNAPRRILDSYFYFAYPFLLAVPGYDVRARGLPDEERDRNLAMLRWISDETAARGLHFQLALWTHAYEFADSPDVNYPITGLTPEIHAAYCRDALRKLLEACPAISGITLRCHSESGIPQGSYEFWPMIFDGIARCGRRVEIDIHSKGIEHKLLDMALETGLPVNVSPKYWAEHMGLPYHQAAIQEGEKYRPVAGKPATIERQRSFTRYGYADYLREDRAYGVLYRIWPGTQRFLLWGDPATAAGYGRLAHFCGSLGLELCEPLSFKGRMGSGLAGDRNGYAEARLRPTIGDWEKHLITYRLWGRLLYNPNADSECWRRFFRSEFGPAAADCEAALANASRVLPLVTTAHLPSASNNGYWPEIYTSLPIMGNRFGAVRAIDPGLFSSAGEFADELTKGPRTGRYSPLEVAYWLESLADAADAHLAKAQSLVGDAGSPAFRRLTVDVAIQSGTGRFRAQKLRAAVAHALGERLGDREVLQQAVNYYRAARDAWKRLVSSAQGVYQNDLTYGREPFLRGHWADRLAAIETDLAEMEKASEERPATQQGPAERTSGVILLSTALGAAATPPARPRCAHVPPAAFRPGEALVIEAIMETGYTIGQMRLHYRHVNQGEEFRVADFSVEGDGYRQVIPADYTDSPYPLMYFFELHDGRGDAWLHPGLAPDLSNQPYYVVRQRS